LGEEFAGQGDLIRENMTQAGEEGHKEEMRRHFQVRAVSLREFSGHASDDISGEIGRNGAAVSGLLNGNRTGWIPRNPARNSKGI